MLKTGILLINLGSPESPAVKDVRRYLNEFLMDPRVLDYPYWLRRLLVSLIILPTRPKKSARAYQTIWWENGSPLIVISQRLQRALQARLEHPVSLGMRYGKPAIRDGLLELVSKGVQRVLAVPLYPHYAMSTYETVAIATRRAAARSGQHLSLEFVPPFYQHPDYVQALVTRARPYLDAGFDHLLFSYHGLPERHLQKSDPTQAHCLVVDQCCSQTSSAHATCYRHQALTTTHLFIEAAGVDPHKTSVAFQSRLGRETWLKPYTDTEIQRLARSGIKKLLVICPAFVSDCLETLEEIGIRGKESFLHAGGSQFELIPCLNDHPTWVSSLAKWCS